MSDVELTGDMTWEDMTQIAAQMGWTLTTWSRNGYIRKVELQKIQDNLGAYRERESREILTWINWDTVKIQNAVLTQLKVIQAQGG